MRTEFVTTTGTPAAGQVPIADGAGGYTWAGQAAGGSGTGNMTDRGAWAASTVYSTHDVVTFAGAGYVCVTAHTSASTLDTTKFVQVGEFPLIPVSVVTGAYTAQNSQFVPCDLSAGALTVTLQSNPVDGARIGVKIVKQATTPNPLTIAAAGSQKFNIAGGSTTLTLVALFQGVMLKYQASTLVWSVQASDTPLGQKGGGAQLDTATGLLLSTQLPSQTVTGGVAGGIPAWTPSTVYPANTLVSNAGETFVCLLAHTSGGSFTGPGVNWQLLPVTLASLSDVTVNTPTDGQSFIYNGGQAKWASQLAPWLAVSGPNGLAMANSGTTLALPAPDGSAGYGRFDATLAPASGSTVTITAPAPARIGSRCVLRLAQGSGGGISVAWAGSPVVVDRGALLAVDKTAFGETWVALECGADSNGNPTWYAFPATSAIRNAVLTMVDRVFTANQTLSGVPSGMTAGQRALLTANTTGSQNGPWLVASTAWTRPDDYQSGGSLTGALAAVSPSSPTLPGTIWALSATSSISTIDTSGTTWVNLTPAAGGGGGTQNNHNLFGDGSDGALTLATGGPAVTATTYSANVYTLTRDVYATSLTVNSSVTLVLNGYRVFVTGTLTNNGTIGSVGASASGTNGSSGGSSTNIGSVQGGQGGANGVAGAGTAGSKGTVGTGGGGGAGGTGAAGAAAAGFLSNATQAKTVFNAPYSALAPVYYFQNATQRVLSGGTGGSSGGGDGTNLGGGGGAGGPLVLVFAATIVNNGVVQALGGAGGTPTTGNCGGGGGGSGGLILLYAANAVTGSGSVAVTGGSLGAGVGTGATGVVGGAGVALTVVMA